MLIMSHSTFTSTSTSLVPMRTGKHHHAMRIGESLRSFFFLKIRMVMEFGNQLSKSIFSTIDSRVQNSQQSSTFRVYLERFISFFRSFISRLRFLCKVGVKSGCVQRIDPVVIALLFPRQMSQFDQISGGDGKQVFRIFVRAFLAGRQISRASSRY